MTRDEDNNPITELAESVEESDDQLKYTFKLRPEIRFHNGNTMTSADVVASFDRYKQLGIEKVILNNVASWEAPDELTFVINMATAQPTFLEDLSSFSVPIVIVPAENTAAAALQLEPIGTGPFKLVEFVADSHVKLERFDDYQPNAAYQERTGFGGYKVALSGQRHFPHRHRTRLAGRRSGDRRAARRRRRAAGQRRPAGGKPGHQNRALRELLDPPGDAKLRQTADRQPRGARGDPHRARSAGNHGSRHRRRLQPELRVSATEPQGLLGQWLRVFQHQRPGKSQSAAGRVRLQRRGAGAADQQRLQHHVQRRAGDGRAG